MRRTLWPGGIVLGFRRIKIGYVLLTLLAACAAADEIITDQAELLTETLALQTEQGRCVLSYLGQKQVLKPEPPCYFLRAADQKLQYHAYPEQGVEAVLIVRQIW